ncbi:UPF0272 protein [Mycolicibacterium litorale]|uniref:Pyridinium-3,5-bisthiocarboxylic acid mononucleotide nickel insertion protein n=1 Tax=Mycolicibacterium litorale TaxID=758802 RepID=A0A6S6NZD5_9MYCO|nr:nickel pincer cofactor biosynthesis protein LarC [Mycolicibacterium litorale]BCI51036.1 UPF0272 protein [Mycolicibacterium litorale]
MILWLNPTTGISGDMLLGALLGLGAPVADVRSAIASSGLTGWELERESVSTHGIAATRAVVRTHDTATARPAAELLDLIGSVRPEPVAAMAAETVRLIAECEARLHGQDLAAVHLHEIGGIDTVVDTVGVAAALRLLDITDIYCAPIGMGAGVVDCAHGTLPAPAPATLSLLTGAQITGVDIAGETVTPTGAALLRVARARYGPPPPMTVTGVAFGAGTRRFAGRPNILTAVLGWAPAPIADEQMVVLETNVDDVTGEELAHVIASALDAGAADAWCTPAVMKKGRPAHVVHVLCHRARADHLGDLLAAETGSLGIRRADVDRRILPRIERTVEVHGHPIRVKCGPWRAKPERDDVVAVAEKLGVSARRVSDLALAQTVDWPTGYAAADDTR